MEHVNLVLKRSSPLYQKWYNCWVLNGVKLIFDIKTVLHYILKIYLKNLPFPCESWI